MEVCVLDVYKPSLQEQQSPILYADNVREKCARALNIPTTNHTFEDMLLLTRALQLNLPSSVLNVEIEQVKKIYKITLKEAISILERFRSLDKNMDGFVDFTEFLNLMHLPNNGFTRKLFRMFDGNHNGLVDFKEFISGLFLLSNNIPAKETIQMTFQALDCLHNGSISFPQFGTLFKNSIAVASQDELEKLFTDIDTDKNGVIDATEFTEYATAHPEFCFLFQCIADAIKNNSTLEVSSMISIHLKAEIEASSPSVT